MAGSGSPRIPPALFSLPGIRVNRLQTLIAVAVALAGVAGATNYTILHSAGTRRSFAIPSAAPFRSPGESVLVRSSGDRSAQIHSPAQYLAMHADDVPARFELAELYFRQQDYQRFPAELYVLERQRPVIPEAFLREAVVLKHAGRPILAEKAVRRALALDPHDEPAREWLGEIYLDQRRSQQAVSIFGQCLRSWPNSSSALLGKGRALEQLLLSRHPIPISAVIQPVEQAVRIEPDKPEGLITLARMRFVYQNRADEAEKLALHAVELEPGSARSFLLLSRIALFRSPTSENLRRAGEYAYEAGRRDLQDPRPAYFIGRVFLQQNDVARAVKALEHSVVLGATPAAVSLLSVAYRRGRDRGAGRPLCRDLSAVYGPDRATERAACGSRTRARRGPSRRRTRRAVPRGGPAGDGGDQAEGGKESAAARFAPRRSHGADQPDAEKREPCSSAARSVAFWAPSRCRPPLSRYCRAA